MPRCECCLRLLKPGSARLVGPLSGYIYCAECWLHIGKGIYSCLHPTTTRVCGSLSLVVHQAQDLPCL